MIAVCVKWVAGPPEPGDDRFAGTSPSDQAALELALRQAAVSDDDLVVVTAGPPSAERALRDALACGATDAVRIALPVDAASGDVAECLAAALAGASYVWCGDVSADRGSGSVPAFLAGRLSARQALGAVAVELDAESPAVVATRRLDGGRREVLRVEAPAVVSVEGAAARLRRAALPAVLAARAAPIDVRHGATTTDRPAELAHPYRPRARALAAPTGDTLHRLRALTDVSGAPAHGEVVHLEPAAAAERIALALREWGYL